jgi:tRNA (guanine26-N2/guanine27-N2)-dimethyltransferase
MNKTWIKIREGETLLYVPRESIKTREPPLHPVFFNPAAKLNRDISVILSACTQGRTFLDLMCGVGARSVRIAKESKKRMEFHANDINKKATEACRRNAILNSVKDAFTFSTYDANFLLFRFSSRGMLFDYVDVDPFGSPSFFVQAAVETLKEDGILSITATDTAVLCGPQRKVAERRYLSKSLKCSFSHELGLRILAGFVSRISAINDVGTFPVLAHSTRHYLRIYFRIDRGPSKAENSLKSILYLSICKECNTISVCKYGERCKGCGSDSPKAGPLWTGELTDKKVVSLMKDFSKRKSMDQCYLLLDALERSVGLPPYSFSIEEICSSIHVASVPFSRVKTILEKMGYRCEKQPYERTGLKTDAPYREVLSAVKEASRPGLNPPQ